MAGNAGSDRPRRPRRWAPFTFAAAAALVVPVLVLPWTPWPEGYGHVPWWVWGPLVAAVVLLLVGVGGRRYTTWAGLLGGTAMVAGVVSFLTWPREEVVLEGRTQEQVRAHPWPGDTPPEWGLRLYPADPPAAPLACALAAAVVLVLCVVVLVRRQDPWMGPRAEEGEGLHPTRATRRAMAAGLVGVLVGGLSGAGTAYGANELRIAALEPWWGPLAESVPVPEDRLHEGSVEWDRYSVPLLPKQPTQVSWQHDFAGPMALSTCRRDGRARATLVALDESAERSVIIGHDARDGTPRWSLTVHRQETAELTQVAVGGGCSVLVLIGTVLLAVDTYTGQVVGSSVLPAAGLGAWQFIGPAEVVPPPRLVGLREAQYAHLTSDRAVVTVRRSDAELIAGSGRPGVCAYLAEYSGHEGATGQLLLDRCSDLAIVVNLPELATPEKLRAKRPPPYRVPPLQPQLATSATPVPAPPPGCTSGPLQIQAAFAIGAVVETTMNCAGKQYRARTVIDSYDYLAPEWTLSPEVNVAPDLTFVRSRLPHSLLEVRGDTVAMVFSRGSERWWTVSPKPGDPVVGLADIDGAHLLDGWQGPTAAGTYSPILALTRSGSLVTLAEFRQEKAPERVRVLTSSDVAHQPCAGERELLADKTSGTALVLCTTNDGTHVTAVTD